MQNESCHNGGRQRGRKQQNKTKRNGRQTSEWCIQDDTLEYNLDS